MYLFRPFRFNFPRNPWSWLVLSNCVLLVALACGCHSPQGSASGSGGSKKSLTVGVVFDSGGLGDKSFNDSANEGLKKAEKDFGIKAKYVQSASAKDYKQNITAMAQAGCNLVFAVGLNQADALKEVAPQFPNVKFAIVDGDVDAPNVRSLNFDEEQGSFLAGYLAANVTKTKKLGFVGGEELDLIKKFLVGYTAGAYYANPTVTVLPAKYVGDWDNVGIAHAEALQLFGSGADIVYHAAGRAGLGVLTAAKEQGKYAIGVDSDQDDIDPGYVLTSMIKRVDQAVYQTIEDTIQGKFTPGIKVYDLKSNGVGLSDMKYTKSKIDPKVLAGLSQVKQDIISGKIKVPSTEAELAAFESSLGQAKPKTGS